MLWSARGLPAIWRAVVWAKLTQRDVGIVEGAVPLPITRCRLTDDTLDSAFYGRVDRGPQKRRSPVWLQDKLRGHSGLRPICSCRLWTLLTMTATAR